MGAFMRWPAVLLLAAGLTALAAGCKSSGLLEAELRARDEDLRELRAELERTESHNQQLQRELHHAHEVNVGPPAPDGTPAAPPPSLSPSRLKTLTLGRQTGGLERDGIPGDEALQVVLEPRDCDNHTVKIPGSVQITAMEVTPEGVKKPLSTLQVSAEIGRAHV